MATLQTEKWQDPRVTADGDRRASVHLDALETLWFNTGTLCNIECAHCYIESSPTNDRLVYLGVEEVERYLDEAARLGAPLEEVGFTGGEPFMNPELVPMLRAALARGHEALVLTNAMRPMQRRPVRESLLSLRDDLEAEGRDAADRLRLRVSLDHHTEALHDEERGEGSWREALEGLAWLRDHGFRIEVAGRTRWEEDEAEARAGYARLFEALELPVDASDPVELVLFPEMDEEADVPEITTGCWEILGRRPSEVMCASSRMVVKRKGAERPTVLACTLIPYDEAFELGETLAEADREVPLNHPHCSKFCVLGGASCSG